MSSPVLNPPPAGGFSITTTGDLSLNLLYLLQIVRQWRIINHGHCRDPYIHEKDSHNSVR